MSSANRWTTAQLPPPPRRKRSARSTTIINTSEARRTTNSSGRNVQHRQQQKELSFEKHRNTASKGQSSNRRKRKERKNTRKIHQGSNENVNLRAEPKERPKMIRKIYRKKKVFRTWVLPALFLVPLAMIWLEYYIGKLIGLEDITDAYKEQLVHPWDLLLQDLNASSSIPPISSSVLPELAYAPRIQCPPGQRRMINIHNPMSHAIGSGGRRIPMIVHQQSKTRCLTRRVDKATTQWAFRRWSYYIHDDDSRSRLFDIYSDDGTHKCEFPLLSQIVTKCIYNQTNVRKQLRYYDLKNELWKFLTLWLFGGVYTDLGFLPMNFNRTTIDTNDDGFFLIDPDTQMLSTKLMAVSPRHPIMYYAIHQLLLHILLEESSTSELVPVGTTPTIARNSTENSTEYEGGISGSSILTQAFRMFQEGYDVEGGSSSIVPRGVFQGVMNRTVRIVASGGLNLKYHSKTTDDNNGREDEQENDLVISIFKSEKEKDDEYRKMGMVVYTGEEDDASSTSSHAGKNHGVAPLSCLDKLYHLSGVSASQFSKARTR